MHTSKNSDDFRLMTKKDGIVIAEFGSRNCPPCRDIRLKTERWLSLHPEIEGIYVPVEEQPETAAQNGVFSAPTVRVYVNGKMTVSESGYFSLDLILQQAERYLSLLS